jgi:signal-transduction protein with cAMP-binding, CBS, and nucleotidyltransferase domain
METGYDVGDVMSKNVLTIAPDADIIESANLMAKRKLGSIVVCCKGKVVGILTEQDLARKVLAREVDTKKARIKDIMTKRVYTTSPEKDLYEAMLQMGENKVKHLPVIKEGKLVGIISFKDIIRIEPDLIDMVSFKSSLTKGESNSIFPSRA